MIIENNWVLTRKETAEYLGINIRTLDGWVKRGKIKSFKKEGRVYFSIKAIYEAYNLPVPEKYYYCEYNTFTKDLELDSNIMQK